MASSDDDEEILPEVVSGYYFIDAEDVPVSFTELPVHWGNGERSDDKKSQIYLRGNTDNGLQKVHKQVKAWKYEFLKVKPEISVLSIDKNWIKLQKTRKCFENKIRTIMITVHCLHFLWSNPKASSKAVWNHLCKVFSLYEIRPSENDLMDHLNFIHEAVKRDNTLQKSKFLASLLEGRSRNRIAFDQNAEAIMKPSFIVDDKVFEYEDDDTESESADDTDTDNDDDDDGIFDTVCAICDNGGDLTCCEGKCLRSFHATVKSARAAKSSCKSLGLHPEEVKGSQPFFCLNCSHEQHQCFVCGKLGSSNKSHGAEVFRCISATCSHFYHPHCVAMLLEEESDTEAHILEEKIASSEPFTCPAHKCHKCKQWEDEKVKGLQFAVCRRCPRSYHRKCLPSKIVFYNKDNDKDVIARAWNNLLPKSRALIYCLKHKMDHKVGTAVRNIKFPEINCCPKNVAVNEDIVNSDYESDEVSVEIPPSSVTPVDSSRKRAEMSLGSECLKKQRASITYKTPLKQNLSIEAEKDSKKDHTLIDTEKYTDAASPVTLDMVESNDNNATGDPYVDARNGQPDNKNRKLDIAQHGYNREAHFDKTYGIGSWSQRTMYIGGQHDSCFSSRYRLTDADPLSYNWFSTLAMNQYTPKLDELNHTWMKKRGMWDYDQPDEPCIDASRFAPRPYLSYPRYKGYRPFTRHNPRRPFTRHNPHRPLPRHNPHRPLRRHNPYHPLPQDHNLNELVDMPMKLRRF